MSSFIIRGLSFPKLDMPSTSGRSEVVRRVAGGRLAPRSPGSVLVRSTAGEAVRPPAGPSSIMCSSLGKERKKLAKVLKSHRKILEKKLAALTTTEVDSPVFSELLTELRVLRSHLTGQRAAALLYADNDSDSSDSDDECTTRTAAMLCTRRPLHERPAAPAPAPAATPEQFSSTRPVGNDTSILISGLTGQIEIAVPEPEEGWQWDEDQFRGARFEGACGRVLVCTGSKCQRKGGTEVLRAVSALSEGNPSIEVVPCKCVGKCSAGAALRVRPQGLPCATYTQVRPGQLPSVFQEHFGGGAAVPAAGPAVGISELGGAAVGVSELGGAAGAPLTSQHASCCAECRAS